MRAIALLTAAASATGCAAIWGFQDAIPETDAGAGSSDDGSCTCVPMPPDGWQGPYELAELGDAAPAAAPPACAGSYPSPVFTGYANPSAAPATCACSCDAPLVTCSSPAAMVFSDISCGKPCATVAVGATCTEFGTAACSQNGGGPGKATALSATFAAPIPTAGTCTPRPAAGGIAAPWTQSAGLCGTEGAPVAGSCAAGSLCAPPNDVGFEADTYCVMRVDPSECPPTYPSARTTYYEAADDSRTCACACDPPTDVQCPALDVTAFTGAACGGAGSHVVALATCVAANSATVAAVAGTGACTPHGTPAGSFAPTGPITICCTR